jgi:hypothetical protein
MAKSFRLDPDLERRLAEAAAREGIAVSALIRDAVRQRCDDVLGTTLLDGLGDIVGSVDFGSSQSHRTGQAFATLLRAQSSKHRGE